MPYNGSTFDHLPPPTPQGTRGERLLRRAIVWPAYTLTLLVLIAAAPILLPLAIIFDIVSRTNWVLVRSWAFFVVYFAFELYAVVRLAAIYLFVPRGKKGSGAFYRAQYGIQRQWVANLTGVCIRIFNIRIIPEGLECLSKGPYLLFVRHASLFDTILIPYFLFPVGMSMRVVLKRELLYDAALDLSFNALPNYFVHRGTRSEQEIKAVGNLIEGISEHEVVFLYPEGTRRTPEKHARILQKIKESGDTEAYEQAKVYKHVLPPRPGGPLELLRRNENCDLVICTHAGLEHTTSFKEVYRGGLVGLTIHMGFWRIPFSEIPKDPVEQKQWLFDEWKKVDDWIDAHLQQDAELPAAE